MRKYMQEAAPFIKRREYFEKGSIKGVYPEKGKNLDYVIYSYTTPIAFFASGKWYLTDKTYSQTTTRQQHALRMILSDEGYTTLDEDAFSHNYRSVMGE